MIVVSMTLITHLIFLVRDFGRLYSAVMNSLRILPRSRFLTLRRGLGIFFVGVSFSSVSAGDFFVNAGGGSDGNPGTRNAPFKTLAQALASARGGETIFLFEGEYPAIEYSGKAGGNIFEGNYVTIKPAPEVQDPLKSVSIERVKIGARAGVLAGEDKTGSFDVWLRLENLRLPDGVFLFGGRHLQLAHCRIERAGPWVGSVENIEKSAVELGGCSDVLIEKCDITNTGIGLTLNGSDIRVVGNRIHDIRHDGIRCVSAKDTLIENNEIFNLDDGVEDSEAKWSRHCDGIHIFIPGPGTPGAQNSRVTVRGNKIYNCESQGIQFNNYLREKDLWNEEITIENNVFGPTRANAVNIADPVDGIIFRHNTFVVFPEERTFKGEGRDIVCNNSIFRINPACKRGQVYNNILSNSFEIPRGWFVGNNVLVSSSPKLVPTRFDVVTQDAKLADPAAFDGRLAADSPAVNVGTRLAPAGALEKDLMGTQRDARPDAGAFEVAGQNPVQETPPVPFAGPAKRYVDDFRDANLDEDPWLAAVGQRGIAWTAMGEQMPWGFRSVPDEEGKPAVLFTPQGLKGASWMFSNIEDQKGDARIRLIVANAYNQGGSGVLLRANRQTEGYLVDLAGGRIVRRSMDAAGQIAETVLVQGAPLLPRTGFRTFAIALSKEGSGVKISVDADADGSPDLEAEEKPAIFQAGGLALYNLSRNGAHRTDVKNLEYAVPP